MKKHRIKRIHIDQLRTGMYIHDLNCGWTDHPFLSSRFLVANARQAGGAAVVAAADETL